MYGMSLAACFCCDCSISPPAVTWSGAAGGAVSWPGTAGGSVSWSGAAGGAMSWPGAAGGAVSWSGAAGGSVSWPGAAGGSVSWSGAAGGAVSWPGATGGVVSWPGAAGGAMSWPGAAGGAVSWPGAAGGAVSWPGAAGGSVSWPGAAGGAMSWPGAAGAGGSVSGDRLPWRTRAPPPPPHSSPAATVSDRGDSDSPLNSLGPARRHSSEGGELGVLMVTAPEQWPHICTLSSPKTPPRYEPSPRWGGGGQRAPCGFSQIAPEVLGISLWNLPYLSGQQFNTLCQKIRTQVIIGQPWVTSEWRHVSPILTNKMGLRESPPLVQF